MITPSNEEHVLSLDFGDWDGGITTKDTKTYVMYRIMYELAVCSDGMTEAQSKSVRQNRPASEQPASTLSDIMHTPLLTGAAVVRTRAPEYEKNVV